MKQVCPFSGKVLMKKEQAANPINLFVVLDELRATSQIDF
jgi:hypothetical protein